MNTSVGFIILRHVTNSVTNSYWMRCYDCIRKLYPENDIVIIDDNSNTSYITDKELYKTTVINSEFPGRGELLPYYYYTQNKLFGTAVILHDSVFVQEYIDFTVDTYKIIWTFEEHKWDDIQNETRILQVFNDAELNAFHADKNRWKGCFGAMSIIKHDYLMYINSKYEFSKLLHVITRRDDRCSFERVIACMLQREHVTEPLLGDIYAYCPWAIKIDEADKYMDKPLLKVWTGR